MGGVAGFAYECVFAVVKKVDDASPDGNVVFCVCDSPVVAVVGSDGVFEAANDAVAFSS